MTPLDVATWIVRLAGAYAAAGLLFALLFLFVLRGVDRIDPSARAGSRGFRWIVLPGVAALWPLLLRRWLAGASEPPEESNAHRRVAAGGRG